MRKLLIIPIVAALYGLAGAGRCQTLSDELRIMIAEGKTEEAQSIILSTQSDHPDLCLFIRGLLSANGDSSLFYYNDLLKTYPQSALADYALMLKAQLAYARGLYQSSLSLFNQLIRSYKTSTLTQKGYYWIGLCHQAMQQRDSANYYFRKVKNDFEANDTYYLADNSLKTLREEERKQKVEVNLPVFYIQVGAFSRQSGALNRKAFFERRGYSVSFRQKTREGTILYLVWLGSFHSRDEARGFGESLKKKKLIKDYMIVSE